jgi:hypothetical protein
MQRVSVVQHEEGDIAQRIDAVVVRAVLELVVLVLARTGSYARPASCRTIWGDREQAPGL